MGLFACRSRVVSREDGTVWLEPHPDGLRRRRAAAGGAGALGAVAVAVTLVVTPWPLALAAAAAGAVAGGALVTAAVRAGGRVAATPIGVSLLGPGGTLVGWDALSRVGATRAGRLRGGRRRVVVEAGDTVHECATRFQPPAVRAWLEACAVAAAEAGLRVEDEDGDGFRVAGRAADR